MRKSTASIFIMMISFLSTVVAQKTYTIKVRAPKTKCTVTILDTALWLEKSNLIKVDIVNPKEDIQIVFRDAKAKDLGNGLFDVQFERGGKTYVSVFQTYKGRKQIAHVEELEVLEPDFYFCGVKVGTKARGFKVNDDHFKAYSNVLDTAIKVKSYDFVFYDGLKEHFFHSDSCMLSQKMFDILFKKPETRRDLSFRFGKNKRLYVGNITAELPNKEEITLTPVELFLHQDSTNLEEIDFVFYVNRFYKYKPLEQ